MPETEPLAPLLDALNDLTNWLEEQNIPGVVIGGVAASLLGRPRVTRDVDALVILDEKQWEDFLKSAGQFNFIPRISDPIEFARQARVFLLKHKPSEIDVDISLGSLSFEKNCINRATRVTAGSITVSIPSPEDLIIMKGVAHRNRDLIDIESVMETHSQLNIEYIRQQLSEFSAVLEMPEILEDFETIRKRLKISGAEGK